MRVGLIRPSWINLFNVRFAISRRIGLNPEIVIIGGEPTNPNRNKLADFYRSINGENVHLVEGEWEDAELTKIFYNTFLTYKITYY